MAIALVEALVPERRTTPWLGTIGLTIVSILFVLTAGGVFYSTYQQERFLASPPQLIGTTVVIVALITDAFMIGRRPRPHTDGTIPQPWVVGVVSLAASSLFMAVGMFIADISDWGAVGGYLVLYAVVIGGISRGSRREGWGAAHRLALAGGALLTYAWHAFPVTPTIGTTGTIDVIGNVVFALGAVGLLAAAVRTVYRSRNAGSSVRSIVSGDN